MLVLREITRKPSEEDLELLYDLLQERPSYANISHDGVMPSREAHEDHVKTFARKGWWVIEEYLVDRQSDPFYDQKGAIYLSKDNEIGIAILASRRNKGYATWAILKVIELFPGERLRFNTAPGNELAQRLAEKLGFRELQRTYVLAGS